MAKTKAEKAQEAHVEAELALFEEKYGPREDWPELYRSRGGTPYPCRGPREEDLSVVLAKLEDATKGAAGSAEAKLRKALAARAAGQEGDAARHERNAATQSDAAGRISETIDAVLVAAGKMKEVVDGDVTTSHVIDYLMLGREKLAATLNKVSRKGCGYDLVEVIAGLPRDGQSHSYVCPKCGREGHASKTEIVPAEA